MPQTMREKRDEAYRAIKEFRAKNDAGTMTDEDLEAFNRANEDFDTAHQAVIRDEEIDRRARLLDSDGNGGVDGMLDTSLRGGQSGSDLPDDNVDDRGSVNARGKVPMKGPNTSDEHLAFNAWARSQIPEDCGGCVIPKDELDACKRMKFKPTMGSQFPSHLLRANQARHVEQVRSRFLSGLQTRAATNLIGTAAQGEEFGFETFTSRVEIARLAFGGLRQVASILTTGDANPLHWPTADDTTNEARRLGEDALAQDTGFATGRQTWYGFDYSSDFVKVTFQLLRDANVDVAGLIGPMLGERLARKQNRDATTGNGGTTEPEGLTVNMQIGVTAASATLLADDELVQMQYSIDDAYDTNSIWMMNKATELSVRLLKDSNGRYLWASGLEGLNTGRQTSLLGDPIQRNTHMPNIATGTVPITYGDHSSVKWRDIGTVQLAVARERFIENGEIAFIARNAMDSRKLRSQGAEQPVKGFQMA